MANSRNFLVVGLLSIGLFLATSLHPSAVTTSRPNQVSVHSVTHEFTFSAGGNGETTIYFYYSFDRFFLGEPAKMPKPTVRKYDVAWNCPKPDNTNYQLIRHYSLGLINAQMNI